MTVPGALTRLAALPPDALVCLRVDGDLVRVSAIELATISATGDALAPDETGAIAVAVVLS